jgi:hypothetical protein
VAFDITKNLAAQVFPKVEMPEVRSPVRVDRLEKAGEPLRSFQDELASEPAKPAELSKKPLAQAVDTVRQKVESAPRPDQVKLPAGLKSPLEETAAPASGLLQKFGTEQQEDILRSPAAVLLAGPLQQMTPQDMPTLTAGSQFLNDLLLNADPTAVLEQDGDMASVLDSLGVSGEIVAGLRAEFGEDLPQVSAADVFAAAGIDPSLVLARLNMLREQMVPQIDPALSVPAQIPQEAAAKVAQSVQEPVDTLASAAGNLGRNVAAGVLKDKTTIGGLEQEPTDVPAVEFGGPVQGALTAPWTAAPEFSLVDPVDTAAASAELPVSVSRDPVTSFSEFRNWRDAAKDVAPDLKAEAPALQPAAFENASAVPMGRMATFDAFRELGDRIGRLSPEQVTEIDMSQETPVASKQETAAATPKFMDSVISRFGTVGLNPDAKPNGLNPASGLRTESMTPSVAIDGMGQAVAADGRIDDRPVLINGKQEHLVKGMQTAMQQGAALSDNQSFKTLFDATPRKFTVDELMADVTAGRMNLDLAKPDTESFTQSEGGDLSRFAGEHLSGGVNGGLEKPQAFGADFAAMLSETQQTAHVGMSTAERVEMAQKVLDNATFLMRQGSGSVRLDLSNASVGPLEVAINLADNKVDIKVFTESDPVREAMIADLGRLKEALQTQNVNLNQVEVGVGQRFGGSASSDQNRQFAQQQELREAFASNNSFSLRNDNSSRRPEVSQVAAARRLGQMTSQVSSDGRLKIRI